MPSFTLHEPAGQLTDRTIDIHRAIVSLMEELEAIDWYNQRAEACTDPELRGVLEHNRNEEIEHASMTLEWDPAQRSEVRRSFEVISVHERGHYDHRGTRKNRNRRRRTGQAGARIPATYRRRYERKLIMADERSPGIIPLVQLLMRIEEAAVAAAREILSGRRIVEVDGPWGIGLTTVEVGNDV